MNPNRSQNPRQLYLLYGFSFVLLLVFSAIIVHLYLSRPKIAYVRTLELVYGYNGMKQAHTEFKSQTDEWQANIDTLRISYQRSLAKYQQDISHLSPKEKEEQQTLLARMEKDLNNYASVIQDEAKEKEKKMTESVLNQINSYVETYAKKKGYDMVLGAEGTGSIIYATKGYDITEEVLSSLNSEYKIVGQESKAVSLNR